MHLLFFGMAPQIHEDRGIWQRWRRAKGIQSHF